MAIRWDHHRNLLVGFFVFSSLITFAVFMILLVQRKGYFETKFNIYAVFENGIGLREGTDVQFNGVKIGRVESVRLLIHTGSADAVGKVVLHLALDKTYNHLINDQSVAFALRDKNLVSDRIINIENIGPSEHTLSDGDSILVSDSRDIESVLSHLTALMGKTDLLLTKVGQVVQLSTDSSTTIGALLGSRVAYDRLLGSLDKIDLLADQGQKVALQTDTITQLVLNKVPNLLAQTDSITSTLLNTSKQAEILSIAANRLASETGDVIGRVDQFLLEGTDQMAKAGDLIDAVSNFWLIRRKLEGKDEFPILANGVGP